MSLRLISSSENSTATISLMKWRFHHSTTTYFIIFISSFHYFIIQQLLISLMKFQHFIISSFNNEYFIIFISSFHYFIIQQMLFIIFISSFHHFIIQQQNMNIKLLRHMTLPKLLVPWNMLVFSLSQNNIVFALCEYGHSPLILETQQRPWGPFVE